MSEHKIETALAASVVRWAFVFGFLIGALVASVAWAITT